MGKTKRKAAAWLLSLAMAVTAWPAATAKAEGTDAVLDSIVIGNIQKADPLPGTMVLTKEFAPEEHTYIGYTEDSAIESFNGYKFFYVYLQPTDEALASYTTNDYNKEGAPIRVIPGENCYTASSGAFGVMNNDGTIKLSERWGEDDKIYYRFPLYLTPEISYASITIDVKTGEGEYESYTLTGIEKVTDTSEVEQPIAGDASAERVDAASAKVTFTSSANGICYYAVADEKPSSIDTGTGGTEVVQGENFIEIAGLTENASNIYLQIKTAKYGILGEISEAIPVAYYQESIPEAVFDAETMMLTGVDATMEYSLDQGQSWNPVEGESVDLNGQAVTETNGIQIVKRGTGGVKDSEPQIITLQKEAVPETPELAETTDTTIRIKGVSGQEYAVKTAEDEEYKNWKDSGLFEELNPDTEYSVVTRVKGHGLTLASDNSQALIISTDKDPVELYKEAAVAELEAYKEPTDYRDAQKDELVQVIENGKKAIAEAASEAEIDAAMEAAKKAADEIKTDLQLTKEEYLVLLENYKESKDYREAQKKELAKAIEDGKKAINAAETKEDAAGALDTAKKAMDGIKTDAQLTKEELEKNKGKWLSDRTGWRYRNADGSYPQNTWKQIASKWYHFDNRGYMKSGWQKISGKWYYLGAPNDGSMKSGWQKISGRWYYLGAANDGSMKSGWQKISGDWYYLGGTNDGAMKTGWLKSGNTWYYLKSSGAMATGWYKAGSTWYYSNGNGAMQTGWLKTGSTWYYLNSSGAMATGWYKVGNTWYYSYSSGAMAANTWVGKYYVNQSGAWTKTR